MTAEKGLTELMDALGKLGEGGLPDEELLGQIRAHCAAHPDHVPLIGLILVGTTEWEPPTDVSEAELEASWQVFKATLKEKGYLK